MIEDLDPVIHNRVRLGILTLLLKEGRVEFKVLKEELGLTDGNLASHLRVLEREGLIRYEKRFVQRRPRTYYEITTEGEKRFSNYLKTLQRLLKQIEKDLK
ncbi:MAG: helix-turn-helix domain-containing protein [Thermotogae bacterium]|nr:helix-turn-helix domain-containing protein [Thermotogota bacterium]